MVQGFDVTYRVTKVFLDRAEVRRRVGEARVRTLGRQGSFLRRRVRTDVLRRRKSVSSPGRSPSIHSRDPVATLKNVLFFYDSRSDSVVVGPVKLNQQQLGQQGNIPIPALTEFGGTITIEEERFRTSNSQNWYRRDLRRRKSPDKVYRRRTASYAARPFMSVALQREVAAGTIPDSWRNAVRG